jgi:hypothetical protein
MMKVKARMKMRMAAVSLCALIGPAFAFAGAARAAALPYAVFPADGSTVPVDAPIRLTFPSASRASASGSLRIKGPGGALAYSLDIGRTASGTVMAKIGSDSLAVHPVIVDGAEAYLFVPAGTLAPGAAYTV